MSIRNTARMLVLLPLLFAPGCKTREEKERDEAAEAFAEAARKLAEASERLGRDRAADGIEKGAQGAAKAAAGMQNAAQAMKNWARSMQGAPVGGTPSDASAPEPVDFRELKALLPETLPNLKRTSASGEKTGVAGMALSLAEASYESTDGKRLRIKLVDILGSSSPLAAAAAGLAMVEIDREDDNGHEKTGKLNGHKTFEKWNVKNEHGEFKVLVADRFYVELDAMKLTMEAVKAAANAIDFNKLAALGK